MLTKDVVSFEQRGPDGKLEKKIAHETKEDMQKNQEVSLSLLIITRLLVARLLRKGTKRRKLKESCQ